ncbi:MAG: hypothetical protein ACYTFM_10085 [Planctomycetota bacterium]|jgi:hypothetical protein
MKNDEQKNLLDLFLKKVDKKELPERDIKIFLKEREAKKELAEEISKYQQEIKEIKAPIKQALLEKMGLSIDEIEKVSNKTKELTQNFQERSEEICEMYMSAEPTYRVPEYNMPQGPGINSLDAGIQIDPDLFRCRDITIRICKEKVCVAQPVPIFLENIFPEGDGEDNFQRSGNSFSLSDTVDSQSGYMQHEGEIEIWSAAELVESSKVYKIGMQFDQLLQPNGQSKENGGCAFGGKDCMIFDWICDVGWGKAKLTWKFELYVKEPGENFEEIYRTNHIEYINTGQIDSRISCRVNNVLGATGHQTVAYTFSTLPQFPTGTQFLNKIFLNYEIEAGGDGAQGSASAYYNLKVKPFMHIEACSWEWPESVTIPLARFI